MQKHKKNRFFLASVISLILSLSILLALLILITEGIYIHIGSAPTGISHKAISIFFIVVAVISIVSMLKDKVIMGIVIGIGIFFILVVSFPKGEYTVFSSEDNKHQFMVIESGSSYIYKLSNSKLYMKLIEKINTDDGYKPFSEGAFWLEWKPSELIIHHAVDYLHENIHDKYNDITIQLE